MTGTDVNLFSEYINRNKHVQDSISIIHEAFSHHIPSQTCISFNGGKDCTVVLHLIRYVVHQMNEKSANNNHIEMPLLFYAPLPSSFEEERSFVKETVKHYNLRLVQYEEETIKSALFCLNRDYPNSKAVFIGCRNDDLDDDRKMVPFAATDPGWPTYMRVCPILEWSYKQIWAFIRHLNLSYCDLYNQGYSSIGTKDNTKKNSKLSRNDSNGQAYYAPAWQLDNPNDERICRSSSDEK